ncbi:MAG: hypothetical protein N2C14_34210, partial [Planctomycetales bacterium]
MSQSRNALRIRLGLTAVIMLASFANGKDNPESVRVATNGVAQLPILHGERTEAAAELKTRLDQITGAQFQIAKAKPGQQGIHVGLVSDFP